MGRVAWKQVRGKARRFIEEEELEAVESELFPRRESIEKGDALEDGKKGETPSGSFEEKVRENLEFLSSLAEPRSRDKIIVENGIRKIGINRFRVLYPVVKRGEERKFLNINYLTDTLKERVDGDYNLLKSCVESKFLLKDLLKSIGIKRDTLSMVFLEESVLSANSFDSLKLYLGYTLLLPTKVSRVEETNEHDETYDKTMNVYTSDFRDIDGVIIGVGISMLKYFGIRARIKSISSWKS